MDLAPPVNVEDDLEVLRVPEKEDDGRMSRDVSVTEGRDLVSGSGHGDLAQSGGVNKSALWTLHHHSRGQQHHAHLRSDA